jgi:N-acetylmuramoyl-L-alanine amidase
MRLSSPSVCWLGAAALLGGLVLSSHMAPAAFQPQESIAPSPFPKPVPSPFLETPKRAASEFFVMIDPSHGGDDKGAVFAGKSKEKDFTLALGRELRRELEERGVSARLLRDSDSNLSLERRAEITNEEHAAIYVALHAGPPGKGARVYMPALPFVQTPSGGRFVPWESAQRNSLERSRVVARALVPELRKAGLPVVILTTPLRPLNNVTAPAIAVEWAPESPQSLESPRLRSTLASALAAGLVQARERMGARP